MTTITAQQQKDLENAVEAAIRDVYTCYKGILTQPLFLLCQYLKSAATFKDIELYKPFVRLWFDQSDDSDVFIDFEDAWEEAQEMITKKVKYVKDALNNAIARAKARTEHRPEGEGKTETLKFFIDVCWELQNMQGEQPFKLGFRAAATVLNESPEKITVKSPVVAGRFTKRLEKDGILKLVEKGRIMPTGELVATSYYFIESTKM